MALFLASVILWSMVWLLYRAWQVMQTPNEVLVDKLGLDIPPAPEVTLEEIGDSEVQITWKLPEVHSSIQKHVIQLNGMKVGETKRHETAVSLLHLKAGSFYDLRVFTASAAGFQTPSRLVHFRTTGCAQKQEDEGTGEQQSLTIRINTLRAPPLPSPSAPNMARETSSGPTQARRTTIGRKHSPGNLGHEIAAAQVDDMMKFSLADDGDDSLAQLSERFQKIQQDNEAAEGQIADEEKEFETSLKELEAKRDELKQSLKERDEASNDLKKQVHKMESANRSAQNEKTKKEKILQQKEAQRKQRKEDITRWTEKASSIEEDLARIEVDKKTVEEDRTKKIEELKQKMEDEQKEVKVLDESIKEKGGQVKMLEEERKTLHADDENDESREADRVERERDAQWHDKLHNLNMTYLTLCNTLSLAKSQFEAARERLAWCENARRTNPAFAPVAPLDLDLSRKSSKQRRGRNRGSLSSGIASPNPPFSAMDSAFGGMGFSQQPVNPSPTFSSGSTFFNMSNGTALGGIPEPGGIPTAEEIDILTGGAPMSPRADALLPANLLGDEESLVGGDDEDSGPDSPAMDTKDMPSLGPAAMAEAETTPRSPSSSASSDPSMSLFQSPRESLQNVMDLRDDQRSSFRSTQLPPIQASPPEKGQSTSQKLGGLFGLNRQRGKTSSEEPPMLGSLKSGQSQSFPRNYEDGFDPLDAHRRRRLSSGNWASGMSSLWRSDDKEPALDRTTSGRRMIPSIFSTARLNPANFGKSGSGGAAWDPFGSKNDAGDSSSYHAARTGSSSPRPSSVYSFDRLPRPSTDKESQPFGWGLSEKSILRGSPLGPDWSTAWSRTQSRRPSFQYGSTSNLSLGAPHEEIGYADPPREPPRPLQAPIGTRPPSSQRPVTPKLNPAAPSFRTIFSKNPERKDKGKQKEVDGTEEPTLFEPSIEDASPPESRKSRDSRSIATANSLASISMADSRESLDRMTTGGASDLTPSVQKESFMQKITRKSSSTKFNSWKDKSGSLFSSSRGSRSNVAPTGEPSTPNEFDENTDGSTHLTPGGESQLSRSIEGALSLTPSSKHEKEASEASRASRSSLSWGFMRKKDKTKENKGTAASEVSEASELTSAASETGDESLHEGEEE